MRLWYLSHMRAAKAQTSLCICGKSSAPSGLTASIEGTFINFRIIAPLGGCEFENRKNSLYFNHHTSIDVCIPTFNRLVFMNSQTVCLFWKEKSSNMDGFSFHLVFLQKIGRSL